MIRVHPINEDTPLSYRAHPFLDPHLPARSPSLTRLWISTFRVLQKDPDTYRRMVDSYTSPAGGSTCPSRTLVDYFHDADTYLDDLLRLVPEKHADELKPRPEIRQKNDILDLLTTMFHSDDPRDRYEAQRKLYIAKLIFDVDHCRTVRDGLRHKEQFETILEKNLWNQLTDDRRAEVLCRFQEWSTGTGELRTDVEAEEDAPSWRFHVRKIPPRNGDPEIDIYHYRARFKKEANPTPGLGSARGVLTLVESPRWPSLGGRSGSIVSKMIRRGIANPRMVDDLLGAMFIVGNRRQAYALERRLIEASGGPLRWRDRIDTLGGGRDRNLLNRHSSSGFLVLKEIVDILAGDEPGTSPYLFSVEIQIFPLEAYLRTLQDGHFANHQAYKKRQFLHDLLPTLFPASIFTEEITKLA